MSPLEIQVRLDGAARRLEYEHNQLAWAVWHIAYLPRTKIPVKLEKLQSQKFRPKQTPEQQLAIMEKWRTRTAHLPPRMKR